MSNKIEITLAQAETFNRMLACLRVIAGTDKKTTFMTPDQLRRECKRDEFMEYEETLEMAYENIQGMAKQYSANIREIKIPVPQTPATTTPSLE